MRTESKKATRWPTAVDLFSGCGAVTAGLKAARFKVLAAVDNDPVACLTYRSNHPSVHLIEEDIVRVDPQELKDTILTGRKLDLMAVCAPCQPFSSHQRIAGKDDRAQLILQSIKFARILNPKVILFENVPGLTAPRFDKLRARLAQGLKDAGYLVGSPTRLDAAEFGVPQRRARCIMLASKGQPPPPLPERNWTRTQETVRTAIGDLKVLQSGQADPNDVLHFARVHRPIAELRLQHIPKDGGSRDSLPSHLQLKCHKNHNGHPDVYGRMRWDAVAPTLTTGCTDLTRGRYAHPRDDRALTLREAARLQTFPDDYKFIGSSKDIASQIGNAVPMRLIAQLAPTLRIALSKQT